MLKSPDREPPQSPLKPEEHADGKILARLISMMFAFLLFGVVAMSANFRAAGVLALAAVPLVLGFTLAWYQLSGARQREREAKKRAVAEKENEKSA